MLDWKDLGRRYIAQTGFYNGLHFYRVILGFMDQFGCPTGPEFELKIAWRHGVPLASNVAWCICECPHGAQFCSMKLKICRPMLMRCQLESTFVGCSMQKQKTLAHGCAVPLAFAFCDCCFLSVMLTSFSLHVFPIFCTQSFQCSRTMMQPSPVDLRASCAL